MSTVTFSPSTHRVPARAVRTTRATRAARPVTARRPVPALRLTRRGRLVLTLLLTAVLLVLAVALASGTVSAGTGTGGGSEAATTTVVVQPGQTLWQIAEQRVPGADPRDVIDRIVSLNALSSPLVHAGQQLLVPTSVH